MPIEDEIKEMEDLLNSDADTEEKPEEPQPEPEPEQPEPEGDHQTDPPVEDEKDELKTDAPTTEAPAPDPFEERFNELQTKYNSLLEKLDALNQPKEEGKVDGVKEAEEEQDFLGDTDPYDIIRDKSDLNKLLNKVYKKAVSDTLSNSQGELENIISQRVSVALSLQQLRDNFYRENPELEQYKGEIAKIFAEEAQKTPDKSYAEILQNVAKVARSKFKVAKDENPPKLPRKKAQNRATPTNKSKDPLQSEIEEMNKSLNL